MPVGSCGPLGDFLAAAHAMPLWGHIGWADVRRRYRRTLLGPLWHTLNLAVFVLVMGVLWSAVLRVDLGGYMRVLPVSMIIWSFVSAMVLEGCSALLGAQSVMLSMRIAAPVFAFALVWRCIIVLAHHMLLYVAIALWFRLVPTEATLLVVPGFLLVCLNGLWMSYLCAMLCLRSRDMQAVIGSAMQIAFFVTPVLWGRDLLGPSFAWAVDWNPLFHMVEVMRQPLLGLPPSMANWAGAVLAAVAGWALTLALHARWRRHLTYWF